MLTEVPQSVSTQPFKRHDNLLADTSEMSPSKPFHVHLSSGTDAADPHEAALPTNLPSTRAATSGRHCPIHSPNMDSKYQIESKGLLAFNIKFLYDDSVMFRFPPRGSTVLTCEI